MMEATLTDKLHDITASLSYFLPEFFIALSLFLVVVIGLFPGLNKVTGLRIICLLGLIVTAYFEVQQWQSLAERPQLLFGDMLSLDKGAVFWKLIFVSGAILATFMKPGNKAVSDKMGEYYALVLSVLLGANLLAMSNNLLMVFLAIELISISSYVLTTFSFNKNSIEAGMKYLLFGAVASAIMIYGMSWLYAFTGSLFFTDPDFAQKLMTVDVMPLSIAGIFVLGGFLFKISAAPMHIWAPDVYTSAPTPVVAFFSVVPKLAGFAILIKWMLIINLFGQGRVDWSLILVIIAMITIAIGNFSALWQKNVKRMLAYSSIAHSGFLLVGIVAFSEFAISGLMFYAAVYLLMNMAAFMFINNMEKQYGYENIEQYSGFVNKSAIIAVLIVVVMISLAGLPPTAGFTAKLLIFTSLWDSYSLTGNIWMLYLLIFGLINTVISLFYYLKIPYYMIFRTSQITDRKLESIYNIENFIGLILVLALLFLFFNPEGLMTIINSVSFAF